MGAYDAVVHIGAPKAGSSAIQAFCLSNRAALHNAGYYYPPHSLDENSISGGHSEFADLLKCQSLDRAKKLSATWISESTRRKKCLLVSAEKIYNKPSELRKVFSDYNVRVVSLFRDPIEALVSYYNQVVKRNYETETIESFVNKRIDQYYPLASGKVYASWIKEFGKENVLVFPYGSTEFPAGKIQLAFLQMLEISASEFLHFSIHSRRVNSSYPKELLDLKRLLNHVLPQNESLLANRVDKCLQKHADFREENQKDSASWLGEPLYSNLVSRFDKSNRHMKDNILFRSSKNFLKYNNCKMLNDAADERRILDGLVEKLFENEKDVIDELRNLTRNIVSKNTSCSSSLLELARLMKIPEEGHSFRDKQAFKSLI